MREKQENFFVVDLGFSSAKWLTGERKGRIKSCYRKKKDDGDSYLYGGDLYSVGEKALYLTGSSYIRTIEELIEFYPLFVGVAALKADIEKGQNLAVGLPYDFFKSESAKSNKGTANVIDSLKKILSEIKINDSKVKFADVQVFPQGLGGIKAYLKNNTGISSGNILGIDIGFNTIIYTLYNIDEGEILAGKTFYKKGIHDMAVNKLLPEISKHFPGKTLTPIELNHVIETKSVQNGIDPIDVSPEVGAAVEAYINDLLSTVIGDLKENLGVIVFDTVLLFGGGANLLGDKLSGSKVKVVVLEEPEYSNAVGFQIRAEEIKKATRRPDGDTDNP